MKKKDQFKTIEYKEYEITKPLKKGTPYLVKKTSKTFAKLKPAKQHIDKLIEDRLLQNETRRKELDKENQELKRLQKITFILIIPGEIDEYLEWASETKKVHKAQVVRAAIEDYMVADSEWQKISV